jgi:predicted nucleic acid-binding protein
VTDELIAAFLARISFRAVFVRDVPRVFDHPRDPKDEPYIDLAAAVEADHLVTRDNDLLYLTTDHSIEAKQFRQRFPSLRVLTPVDFLATLKAKQE